MAVGVADRGLHDEAAGWTPHGREKGMHASFAARYKIGAARRRHALGGRMIQANYPVGPSWQDCGAVGESRCQVGTSHLEQAASESPSKSEATIGTTRRTRRPPLELTMVRIRKHPDHAPQYKAMPQDCDDLEAPEWRGNGSDGGGASVLIFALYLFPRDIRLADDGRNADGHKSIRLDGVAPCAG